MDADDKRATIAEGPPSFDSDRDDSLIGAEIGGYVVEGELGRGGMGVVFAATHPMIGKRVAIKVLKPSLSKNPATVERFVQEARSVNEIGHPNIVDIFAFGQLPDGRSYLIMDLLVGESLRKRVKRGPLEAPEATRVLDEVACALAAAHGKGFIHRDLKPDNLYIVDHPPTFDVKLLDFGLAKLLPNAPTARAFRTATGQMLGTPDYMSPEQLRGTGVDHRTDVYALGVVAFEVLAGERPRRYSDGSFELDGMTVSQHLASRCHAPQPLADLVEQMLAPDVEQRPSLEAVRAVLKRVRTGAADPVRAVGTAPSLGTFEAATTPEGRPKLDTPMSGTQTVDMSPRSVRSVSQPPQNVSQQPQYASQQPQYVSQQPQYNSQQPQYVSNPPQYARGNSHAGLAKASSHPATKLGVAPPPDRPSKPHPVAAARRSTGKLWLLLGIVLVVASTVALVVVLAT